jgi:phosphopantothenoylcysteine decarboxylase / phosphopantothenate---cysteine ligase
MRITLIVTGSIAAYKSAEIVRALKKESHSVRVVMTDSAKQFITPLTLQTLSGEEVSSDMFSLHEENQIGHIRLADEADLLLIAPATANFIAKLAHGIADDLASTVALATRAKVVLAPAMNVNMWENRATRENLEKLELRGVKVVQPGVGELACGWEGRGRMAEIQEILSAVSPKQDLRGEIVVVTAGPTREIIDPVRFISNGSSGKLGVQLAIAARERGAEVVLLTGPGVLAPIQSIPFSSALDLRAQLRSVLLDYRNHEVTLFMAAAPGDYRVAETSAVKLKSDKDRETTLRLLPNPDIVGEIGRERSEFPGIKRIVAFCAETLHGEELVSAAREKLGSKRADLIVANHVNDSMGGDSARVYLIRQTDVKEISGDKSVVARELINSIFDGAAS